MPQFDKLLSILKLTLVRLFLLQGKPPRSKSRPAVILKSASKRPKVIPLDRKENLAQPSSSKSGLRFNKFKVKARKDLTLKTKNIAPEKSKALCKIKKSITQQKIQLELTSKTESLKEEQLSKEKESVHLREICFIKNDDGKTVIAKYDNAEFDDSLIVSWDKTSKGNVYTHKTRVSSAPPYLLSKNPTEPGPSKQGNFRVHNFVKNSSVIKNKFKKHNLRRLASAADILGKVDKKPKRKMKSK